MSKKVQTTLIVIVLILALVLGGMVFGLYWYRTNHIFVEGEAYPKDATYLNLRDTQITVAHYQALREALPDCEIHWDVPFQGKYYPDDTRSLAITGIADGELPLLQYLPRLEAIDANGCRDYAAIAKLQEAYPHIRLLYKVTVDGKEYAQDTTEVTLSHLTDAEVDMLGNLPDLAAVHAEGCTDYDQLLRLQELHPECAVTYTVNLQGQPYPESTTQLEFSGLEDVGELMAQLGYLPKVESVHMEEPTADPQSLQALRETYPGIHFTWSKTLLGTVYSSEDTEIDISANRLQDLNGLAETMAYFPNAEKLILGQQKDIDNQVIAQFREENRANFKTVWQVKVCNAWIPTDDTYFMPVKYNIKVTDSGLPNLVYCEDMLCVDLGHKTVKDLSWLSGMPHLKYLIVAHNTLRELGPIGQLKELIYLEVWDTWATDYTALYGCTALEDLNVSRPYLNVDLKQFGEMPWLKNLWLSQNGATPEEKAYLAEKLPNTNIYYDGYTPTSGGWRELENYYGMRDLLEMPYNAW